MGFCEGNDDWQLFSISLTVVESTDLLRERKYWIRVGDKVKLEVE